MPMEVYYLPSRQWTFLQFRAPVIQACAEDFCVLFLAWIKQVGFSKLFLIGSADGGYRTDCLIEGTPSFRYFGKPLQPLSICPLEPEFSNGKLKGASLLPEFFKTLKNENLEDVCSGIIVFTLEG
ncbi:hypothetical protein HMI56_005451, partial [Coelomomyces lativittatus]